MKAFWLNVLAALFVLAISGGPAAEWARKRINSKVAADERAAAAQIRIAVALEKLATRP